MIFLLEIYSMPTKSSSSCSRNPLLTPFVIFQSTPENFYRESNKISSQANIRNLVKKVYFHPDNVELIQRQLIRTVYQKSGGLYRIERQNERDLVLVMLSVYNDYVDRGNWANDYEDQASLIRSQIKLLNDQTVNEVYPGVLSSVTAHCNYIQDTFGHRQIMDRPENVSSAGTRRLPSVTSLY